jgi:hypothetical protein
MVKNSKLTNASNTSPGPAIYLPEEGRLQSAPTRVTLFNNYKVALIFKK